MSGRLNACTDMVKDNLYVTLVVVAAFSALITYIYLKGGDGADTAIYIDDQSTSVDSIVADVSGAVKSPGVYKLPLESRVVDLLKLAGGILGEASGEWVSKSLNLSTKLSDAQKVYIPFEWEIEVVPGMEEVAPLTLETPYAKLEAEEVSSGINVNTSSQEGLESLPRVGEVTAQKIIDNRPYKDLAEFETKTGLSESVIEEIKALIVF